MSQHVFPSSATSIWSHPITVLAGAGFLVGGSLVLPTAWRLLVLPLALVVPGNALLVVLFRESVVFSGARRLALSAVLSSCVYPILALAVMVAGNRLTRWSVLVSVVLFCFVTAGVSSRWFSSLGLKVWLRRVADEVSVDVPPWALGVCTIALAMAVAFGGASAFERKPADEFHAYAFAGTWALVAGEVDVVGGSESTVQVELVNSTSLPATYVVDARIGDVSWESVSVSVAPLSNRIVSIAGEVPEGLCHEQFTVAVAISPEEPAGLAFAEPAQRVSRSPLFLWMTDRTANCAPAQ